MKRTMWFLLSAGILLAIVAYFYPKSKKANFTVGLVMPIQHVALDDIANGFQSELKELMGNDSVQVEIHNALGDINLQKSSINKFINNKVDLLVPVTTATTQMAINLAPKEMGVLFLAANIPAESETARARPGLMGVVDEIPVDVQVKFIKEVMPELKKIVIIYSSSDKDFLDAQNFQKIAREENIEVQMLMIQSVSELYTVSQRIESDVGALFMLKDNVVASGIATLVQVANNRNIPLITSDEGTNKSGGAFAMGVIEADIGRQGAKMAAEYLKDKKTPSPAIQNVKRILVFVNNKACAVQGINVENVLRAASDMKYEVIKE